MYILGRRGCETVCEVFGESVFSVVMSFYGNNLLLNIFGRDMSQFL